jgi:RNA polymerase sigma factor (sigma-70 family)
MSMTPKANINLLQYDRLACKFAMKYGADPSAIKDSIQYSVAWEGLIAARDRFNPNYISPKTGLPVKFITYAHYVIASKMNGWYQSTKTKQNTFESSHSVQSTLIASGEDGEDVYGGDEKQEEPLAIISLKDERNRLRRSLAQRMRRLSRRERYILKECLLKGRTHTSVAKNVRLSKERVRQMLDRSKEKLMA